MTKEFFVECDFQGSACFGTIEEALAEAERRLDGCFDADDGWEEEVAKTVKVGQVLFTAQKTDVIHRPPEDQIKDGYDSNGNLWLEHWDVTFTYKMLPLEGANQ